jgi:hypothetical protein
MIIQFHSGIKKIAMHSPARTILFGLFALLLVTCRTATSDDRFSRAEETYRQSGALAAAAIYLAEAKKGNPEAAFYVATFYVLEAAGQQKRGMRGPAITKLEDVALHWYSIARKGGSEEARIMLQSVAKRGRGALYISTEHMFSNGRDPERDFSRYRWPKRSTRDQ